MTLFTANAGVDLPHADATASAQPAHTLAQLNIQLGVVDTIHNDDSLANGLDHLTPELVESLGMTPEMIALWRRGHDCRRCRMDPEADAEHHHSCEQFCTPFPPPPPNGFPMPPLPLPLEVWPDNCSDFCGPQTCDETLYPECAGCGSLITCEEDAPPVAPQPAPPPAKLTASPVAHIDYHEPPPSPPSMFSRLISLGEEMRESRNEELPPHQHATPPKYATPTQHASPPAPHHEHVHPHAHEHEHEQGRSADSDMSASSTSEPALTLLTSGASFAFFGIMLGLGGLTLGHSIVGRSRFGRIAVATAEPTGEWESEERQHDGQRS